MPRSIPFNKTLLTTHCIVDVRTPLEFSDDHLPGAINVPILSNRERVEVGTLYKQQGPLVARERGLELACHRFPAIVATIKEAANGRPVLVYCWRGGLRSESVAILLEMSGHKALKLGGGYKTFRAVVNSYFEDFKPPAPLVVLHGMTGSGKTEFLLGLAEKGWSTVDLEGVARHRGSAFGSLGLGEQPSQKRFDTLLWSSFQRLPEGKPIIIEGESKRIGRLTLPGNLYEVMAESCKVWCDVSVETRVARLAKEYAREEYRQPMSEALERIRKKLGEDQYAELHRMLEAWDVTGVAGALVKKYYDRLYYRVRKWEPTATVSLESYTEAENELANVVKST